jgi:hypothetical protein
MSVAAVVVLAVVYPWVAGRVMRHLNPPDKPRHPHRCGRGPYPNLDCDGLWSYDFGMCEACRRITVAQRWAWLWPIRLVILPFHAIYRAGVGTDVTSRLPTVPHEQQNERERARP